MTDPDDKIFFNANPQRQARVRRPARQRYINKQRAVAFADEFELQFRSLGKHDPKQRRVLVWRLPHDHPAYEPENPQLIPIPYVLQEGEEHADTDKVLLPLIHQIMTENAG